MYLTTKLKNYGNFLKRRGEVKIYVVLLKSSPVLYAYYKYIVIKIILFFMLKYPGRPGDVAF
jgi:hypothetical protein